MTVRGQGETMEMVDGNLRFGPYEVHECVGSGGMATVHRATIELGGGIQREVALKRLLPHLAEDDRFIEDFVREAKLAAHLRHPNIIQIFELGRYGGVYFIAMELVRGVSLMSLMRLASRRNRTLPINAIVSLMLELTDALDHAHTITNDRGEPLGLVHRDLTPSNLLVTDDGHLKIIDFGIAKANRGDLATDSGLAKGKLGYMAIEAIRAEPIDGRSDLFSAGVVMWEAITGRRLYKATNEWGQPERDFEVVPPSTHNPECSADLDDIVLSAVRQEPEDRWQSAAAMHRALSQAARGIAATAAEVVRAKQSLRPESIHDPYAGFSIEVEIEDDDDDDRPRSSQSIGDGMGRWWPAEPATEPKLRVEGSSVWPVEPPTEEKAYTPEQLARAASTDEVAVRDLQARFTASDFGSDPSTVPSAPRFSDSTTNKLPTRKPPAPEPPTEPRKPRPKKPHATPARKPEKSAPPPVPRRSTIRKPAPGTTDSPFDTLEARKPRTSSTTDSPFDTLEARKPRTSSTTDAPFDTLEVRRPRTSTFDTVETEIDRDDTKSFSTEADTIEGQRFDGETE